MVYEALYNHLDPDEEEKHLYRPAKQRDWAGKDTQARIMKAKNRNILTSEESVF